MGAVEPKEETVVPDTTVPVVEEPVVEITESEDSPAVEVNQPDEQTEDDVVIEPTPLVE